MLIECIFTYVEIIRTKSQIYLVDVGPVRGLIITKCTHAHYIVHEKLELI